MKAADGFRIKRCLSVPKVVVIGSVRVPALTGRSKGGNVTSAGWQVNCVIPYGTRVPVVVRLVANCYIRLLYFTLLQAFRRYKQKYAPSDSVAIEFFCRTLYA